MSYERDPIILESLVLSDTVAPPGHRSKPCLAEISDIKILKGLHGQPIVMAVKLANHKS